MPVKRRRSYARIERCSRKSVEPREHIDAAPVSGGVSGEGAVADRECAAAVVDSAAVAAEVVAERRPVPGQDAVADGYCPADVADAPA